MELEYQVEDVLNVVIEVNISYKKISSNNYF